MHEHQWTPIDGWYARYRCSECYVIGYRGVLVNDVATSKKISAIIPYKCKKCDKLAVGKGKRDPYCSDHKPTEGRIVVTNKK